MKKPLVIIEGGAYQGGGGDVTVVDLDNYAEGSVTERLDILHDLAEAIDVDPTEDLLKACDTIKDLLLEQTP